MKGERVIQHCPVFTFDSKNNFDQYIILTRNFFKFLTYEMSYNMDFIFQM